MCAVTGVILALVLKSTGSSMGTFVSVVLCVGTAMLVFNGLISVYTRINMFTAGINQEYIKLIVKVIGISYVTEISSNICKENGFAALASAMEIYARISVAGLCIPVIVTLFEMVSEGIVKEVFPDFCWSVGNITEEYSSIFRERSRHLS